MEVGGSKRRWPPRPPMDVVLSSEPRTKAVPTVAPTPAPVVPATEASARVESITISSPSAEEQVPKASPLAVVGPSGARREVVGETPSMAAPACSAIPPATAETEPLVGQGGDLVRYANTPEAVAHASAASGVGAFTPSPKGGASTPSPEVLPPGFHIARLNPWSLPMMLEVNKRLKEMERLEAEQAKFVVEKAE
ncbi:uncharacterized protein LOC131223960 [Magnolia sinica]|uniref:uncharacterized protein LOC131223960 n=1 Tax=Magnolia sinica TaxID=86752 RepID=UPI002658639B|nr:uncharacterized protein LOC131223960 [Magnolia sinica]